LLVSFSPFFFLFVVWCSCCFCVYALTTAGALPGSSRPPRICFFPPPPPHHFLFFPPFGFLDSFPPRDELKQNFPSRFSHPLQVSISHPQSVQAKLFSFCHLFFLRVFNYPPRVNFFATRINLLRIEFPIFLPALARSFPSIPALHTTYFFFLPPTTTHLQSQFPPRCEPLRASAPTFF